MPRLDDEAQQERLEAASVKLRKRLVLLHWLTQNEWAHLAAPLTNILKAESLADVAVLTLDEDRVLQMVKKPKGMADEVLEAARYLQPMESVPQLENLVWSQLQEMSPSDEWREGGGSTAGFTPRGLIFGCVAVIIVLFVFELRITPSDVIWGVPLHKSLTKIEWPEDMTASNSKSIKVNFFNLKGQPLNVSEEVDNLTVAVNHQYERAVSAFVTNGSANNVIEIVFTSKDAGRYYVALRNQGRHLVRGFPTAGDVVPGEPDATRTTLVGVRSSTLVLTTGIPETVQISPRDCFGNLVQRGRLAPMASRFSLMLPQRIGDAATPPLDNSVNFVVYHTSLLDTLCATMALTASQEGWHKAAILLDGEPIGGGDLTLIVLTSAEREAVNRVIGGKADGEPCFEASLVAEDGVPLSKPKSVYCYLTPKQLTIKSYLLRIIPRRLYTFRLVPATRITLSRYHGCERWPVLRLEGSFQSKPEIAVREGNILAASFHLILLRKLGGSESFKDKQEFFNNRLLAYHEARGARHSALYLRVNRDDIVGTSYRATRWFSESDWCRLFLVEFENEPGLDQGGVRREWFELLCRRLLHPELGLFVSIEDNSEAVFPNPRPPQEVRMKMYKFAGHVVGKCLYESAHGRTYAQHLPARLAKSFLAQLVGLRVHYKHFSDDAPQLYHSKIKFIEENTVEDLELTFSDEEFGSDGNLVRNVDLKPSGSQRAVTDENKLEYLDLLAQERLSNRIRQQTEHFLQGLHLFVPDSLLALFDESGMEFFNAIDYVLQA